MMSREQMKKRALMAGITNANILVTSIPRFLESVFWVVNFLISVFSATNTLTNIDAFIFSFITLFRLSLTFCTSAKILNLFFMTKKSIMTNAGTAITTYVASLVFNENIINMLPMRSTIPVMANAMACMKEDFT